MSPLLDGPSPEYPEINLEINNETEGWEYLQDLIVISAPAQESLFMRKGDFLL